MIKTAIVTGATGDLGRAVTAAFLKKGFSVCGLYRSDDSGAAQMEKMYPDMPFYIEKADVSDAEAVERFYRAADKRLGGIGVSVHCAGIERSVLLGMMSTEEWDKVISVNLTGTFNCSKCAFKRMMPRGEGRIINISSTAAYMPMAGQAAYAASKAGVNALTKALAKECARFGITVNAVAPGWINGSMADVYREKYAAILPAERFAEPEDVAAVVCFLAGEDAGYINGSIYTIDGGVGV